MTNLVDSVNLRAMLIPDPGMIIFDCDFEKADVFTVVWESGDAELKAALRDDPENFYDNVTGQYDLPYDTRKRIIHGTNYDGSAKGVAMAVHRPINEIQHIQRDWFERHPGIKAWHDRIWTTLTSTSPPTITNRFGFQKRYWGPPDDAMKREALAWVPQSTVAIATGIAYVRIGEELPWVQLLLDGHDSIVGQFAEAYWPQRNEICDRMSVTVPYPDPMTMVCGIKASGESWAACQTYPWA